MNKAPFLAGLAACLMLAGCGGADSDNAAGAGAAAPPLAGARIGGPFTLTTHDGQTLRWDDLKGKYRIVYFGYSFCPDICPVDLQKIMAGYRIFAKAQPARAAKLQPLFITVDPARDTQAVLKSYVANFPPNLIGLTGTADQIAAAAKAFAVYFKKQDGDSPGATDYLVDHQRSPFLFGPAGEPIAILSTENDKSAEDVARELDQWVR